MLRVTGARMIVHVGFMLLAFATNGRGGEAILSLHEQNNKIRGGWAGQTTGVAIGAPTEVRFLVTGKKSEDATGARIRLVEAIVLDSPSVLEHP